MRQKINLLSFYLIKLGFLLLLCSCVEGKNIIKIKDEKTAKKIVADREGKKITITSIDYDKKKWLLKAKEVSQFNQKKIIEASIITVYAFDEAGNTISTITADSAIIYETKKIIKAKNNVKIESKNGILETKLLYWNLSTNNIYTKEKVKITKGKNIIYGKNLFTDIELNSTQLDDIRAKGEIYKNQIDI